MDAGKDVATIGKAGLNLAIWAGTLFIGAAIIYAGWNWSQKRAAEKAKA